MNTTVGTCGRCGGRVSVPEVWGGTVPPIPACESCHARVKQPWGPSLEMEAPPARKDEEIFTRDALDALVRGGHHA